MDLTVDQIVLFLLIVGVFALLLWGRVRYDIVAFAALIISIITGVVPVEQAFAGFGHPATVIIALVLVVSRGLSNSGAVELIARYVVNGSRTVTMHIGLMSGSRRCFICVDEQRRCVGALDAGRWGGCKAGRSKSSAYFNAFVFCDDPRRYGDPDRDASQYRCCNLS